MERLTDVDASYWLTDWCNEVKLDPKTVTFKIDHKENLVYVFTYQPGIMIGQYGRLIHKYEEELTKVLNKWHIDAKYRVKIVEVTRADRWGL